LDPKRKKKKKEERRNQRENIMACPIP